MPLVTTFAELRDTLDDAGRDLHHRAFRFFASAPVRAPSTYICWQCLEQHKRSPDKRKAGFLFDTFLVYGGDGASTILQALDLGGDIGPVALADGITTIKRVFRRLIERNDGIPSPELFRTLEVVLAHAINQALADEVFDTRQDYAPDARYTAATVPSRNRLAAAGFDVNAMGLWPVISLAPSPSPPALRRPSAPCAGATLASGRPDPRPAATAD